MKTGITGHRVALFGTLFIPCNDYEVRTCDIKDSSIEPTDIPLPHITVRDLIEFPNPPKASARQVAPEPVWVT